MMSLRHCNKLISLLALLSLLSACSGTTAVRPEAESTAEAPKETVIDPQAETKFNSGLEALTARDNKTAEEIFFNLTQTHPELAAPFANLAMLMKQRGELQTAELAYQQAINLDNTNPEYHNQLGILYRGSGRFNKALQAYLNGLSVAPDHTNLLINTGILHDLYLGQPQEALQYYQRYEGLMPDDKQIKIWIADTKQRLPASN